MSTQTDQVIELVRYLVESLVDSPQEVVLTTQDEEGRLSIVITAAADDVGKIIGRSGRTIKSIRTLARASANTASYIVDIDVEG